MENLNKYTHTSPCPSCGKQPNRSQNTAQFDMHPEMRGSVYWTVHCTQHPELFAQGKTVIVAVYNWERQVRNWKSKQTHPKVAHWLGGNYENRRIDE